MKPTWQYAQVLWEFCLLLQRSERHRCMLWPRMTWGWRFPACCFCITVGPEEILRYTIHQFISCEIRVLDFPTKSQHSKTKEWNTLWRISYSSEKRGTMNEMVTANIDSCAFFARQRKQGKYLDFLSQRKYHILHFRFLKVVPFRKYLMVTFSFVK